MSSEETRKFATDLMERVWLRLDSTDVPRSYHHDVVGHHDGPRGSEAAYFYHLRDGKIAEFWLLANVDFDYKE